MHHSTLSFTVDMTFPQICFRLAVNFLENLEGASVEWLLQFCEAGHLNEWFRAFLSHVGFVLSFTGPSFFFMEGASVEWFLQQGIDYCIDHSTLASSMLDMKFQHLSFFAGSSFSPWKEQAWSDSCSSLMQGFWEKLETANQNWNVGRGKRWMILAVLQCRTLKIYINHSTLSSTILNMKLTQLDFCISVFMKKGAKWNDCSFRWKVF